MGTHFAFARYLGSMVFRLVTRKRLILLNVT
jgi:hypothetical protein